MEDKIHGTTLPVLEMSLQPGESLIAESGELSWMTESIQLSTTTGGGGLKGLLKRTAGGGGSFFMTRYSAGAAPGSVSFASKIPGAIFPVDIANQPGKTWLGHRHAFVCGTDGIQLGWGFQRRLGAGLFGGDGFFLQAIRGDGRAWVELSGEVVTYDLAQGQNLRVHPGHVGLFQDTVSFEITTVPGIKNKIFGGDGIFLASLTGPGRVYLQSLTLARLAQAIAEYLPGSNAAPAAGGAIGGLAAGGVIGSIFGNNS